MAAARLNPLTSLSSCIILPPPSFQLEKKQLAPFPIVWNLCPQQTMDGAKNVVLRPIRLGDSEAITIYFNNFFHNLSEEECQELLLTLKVEQVPGGK